MARLSRKSRRNQRQNKSQRRNQQNRRSRRNQRQNKRQNRRSRRNQNRRNRRSRRNIRGGNGTGTGTGAANEDPTGQTISEGNKQVTTEQVVPSADPSAANRRASPQNGRNNLGAENVIPPGKEGEGLTNELAANRQRLTNMIGPLDQEKKDIFSTRIATAPSKEALNDIKNEINGLSSASSPEGLKENKGTPGPGDERKGKGNEGEGEEGNEEEGEEGNQSSSSLSFEPITEPKEPHEGQPTRLEVFYTKDGDEICISKDQGMKEKKCYKRK